MGWLFRINRIRLEFKVKYTAIVDGVDKFVLIESDWNLKEALYKTTAELRKY